MAMAAFAAMMEGGGGAAAASGSELPHDVLRKCLVRVPVRWHATLHKVSREVRALVQSAEYYEQRSAEGVSSAFVCMLQPEQAGAASSFGITVLDLEAMAWERLPAVPGLPGGLPTFARLVAVGGELVVLGGWWLGTWEASRAVLVFNFSSHRWRRGADMASARSFFACGAVGGRVVVAGGHDGDHNALASAEVYDVAADSWSTVSAMRMGRDEPTGVAMAGGRFLVVSGYGSEAQGEFTSSGELYDAATDSWQLVEEVWTPGAANVGATNPPAMTAMDGEVYGVCGKEVVKYSPERNAWTVVAKVPDECEKGEMTSPSIAAVGNSLVITGLVKKNDVATLRTLRLIPARGSCKAQWLTVPCNDQFSSIAQSTCAFEL